MHHKKHLRLTVAVASVLALVVGIGLVITKPAISAKAAPKAASYWKPAPGLSFQWQIDAGAPDLTVKADVYDIDVLGDGSNSNQAATVKQYVDTLHAKGVKVICYLDVGSWEDFRPDAGNFPSELLGKTYAPPYTNEKWLDIRNSKLHPLIQTRLDQCKQAGFDGIEPDNIDGYTNDTGFPLTYSDQLTYNRWLAQEAHARNLSIGLKNDQDQVGDLLASYDWALTEGCFHDGFCDQVVPFPQAGKAFWAVEYTDQVSTSKFKTYCSPAKSKGIVVILKHEELDAYRVTC
jgi:Glycoside-hydrolase family GH114